MPSPFSPAPVPAGTRWYVCCGLEWGPHPEAGYPNPGPARFSPIHDTDDQVVPVLYAGNTPGCALGETVFRDLLGGASVHTNRLKRGMLGVQTAAEVHLADLRATAARAAAGCVPEVFQDAWGGAPGAWGSDHYEASQVLAQLVFDDHQAPTPTRRWDGIVWDSHQNPKENAYLLFTGRTQPLIPTIPLQPLASHWRDEVGRYATSLRVILPVSW